MIQILGILRILIKCIQEQQEHRIKQNNSLFQNILLIRRRVKNRKSIRIKQNHSSKTKRIPNITINH